MRLPIPIKVLQRHPRTKGKWDTLFYALSESFSTFAARTSGLLCVPFGAPEKACAHSCQRLVKSSKVSISLTSNWSCVVFPESTWLNSTMLGQEKVPLEESLLSPHKRAEHPTLRQLGFLLQIKATAAAKKKNTAAQLWSIPEQRKKTDVVFVKNGTTQVPNLTQMPRWCHRLSTAAVWLSLRRASGHAGRVSTTHQQHMFRELLLGGKGGAPDESPNQWRTGGEEIPYALPALGHNLAVGCVFGSHN